MRKTESTNKILRFFKLLYIKLFRINDSPQKIALGMGLGVFSGILPGTGPLAALFLAFYLRVNRASALLGSLLTNTWLSFLTFILAIKVGSATLGIKWQDVRQDWVYFLKRFNWSDLFKLSVLKLILPVMLGYLVIAFCLGLLAYLVTLIIITKVKKMRISNNRLKSSGILFCVIFLLSGCATYKFHHGKAPYDKGYVVSRDDYTILEYSIGKDNTVPDIMLAGKRFKRRRKIVEDCYKTMGYIENRFKMAFWNPCIMFLKVVGGVFKLPYIAISDYKYEHNPKYREKIIQLEAEEELREATRIKKLKDKLNIYIQQDLSKEDSPGQN